MTRINTIEKNRIYCIYQIWLNRKMCIHAMKILGPDHLLPLPIDILPSTLISTNFQQNTYMARIKYIHNAVSGQNTV